MEGGRRKGKERKKERKEEEREGGREEGRKKENDLARKDRVRGLFIYAIQTFFRRS